MLCTSVRDKKNCVFMSKQGCSYNGGTCLPIVEQCEGCLKVETFETGKYCMVSAEPSLKWKNGDCNFSTMTKVVFATTKQKVNPIKESKRKKG